MTPQEIRTLKLLEAIEADDGASQRDLARRLNVSLGLVNAFIKRLARKGYFKVTQIPRKRARYILTPKGALEKTRLTCEYIAYSVSFYREARQRMQRLFKGLQGRAVRRMVLYGVSELAEIAYISMQEVGIRLEAIVDPQPAARAWMGFAVLTPDQVNWKNGPPVLITAIGPEAESAAQLAALGVDAGRILSLGAGS